MSRHPALAGWHVGTLRVFGVALFLFLLVMLPIRVVFTSASADDGDTLVVTDNDSVAGGSVMDAVSRGASSGFDRIGRLFVRFFNDEPVANPVGDDGWMRVELEVLVGYESIGRLEPRIMDEPAEARRIIRLSEQFDRRIDECAAMYRMDPDLLRALIRQESNFQPNAGSHAGAIGLTQLMKAAADEVGVLDRRNPHENICGGARYFRMMYDRFGRTTADPYEGMRRALAAYNAGPEHVRRAGGAVPRIDETIDHGKRILAYYRLLKEYREAARRDATTAVY